MYNNFLFAINTSIQEKIVAQKSVKAPFTQTQALIDLFGK